MTYRKKLIEVALPLDAISEESSRRKRKAPAGYPTTIHKWWAQRPIAACRAVLFASLVDDPAEPAAPAAYLAVLDALPKPDVLPLGWDAMTQAEQRRERLFAFIARLVKWEASTDERILGTARELIILACEGSPPPVLDPFCGGGSIPLEAQRLGLEAHASDLNPVAVLITKALIEIPPKFANRPPVNPENRAKLGGADAWKGAAGLAADVRQYGRWMRDEAERRIGHLYPKATLPDGTQATVIAWLWARTVTCPNPACGARMPLVRSFALSTKPGKQAWVEPVVDPAAKTTCFEVKTGSPDAAAAKASATGSGYMNEKGKKLNAVFRCPACGSGPVGGGYIDGEADRGRMGSMPLAIVAEAKRARLYLPFSNSQADSILKAAGEALSVPDTASKLPTEPARGTFASNAQGRIYGFKTFADYFTPRQLVALTRFSDLVGEARERVRRDAVAAGMADDGVPLAEGGTGAAAYADAVAVYLALALSRVADYGSSIASWRPKDSAMRSTLAKQAIPMVWDYAEGNPFGASSSGFVECTGVVARALDFVPARQAAASVQADATANGGWPAQPLTSTDPPYYDNIRYADLADFFYVWLRRSLRPVYPVLFSTLLTPKARELVATPYRFEGGRSEARRFFQEGLRQAFVHLRAGQDDRSPTSVYYAFKQTESEHGEAGEEQRSSAPASTGWETMLEGLIGAGFQILGTWPMRTEGDNRQVASGANALASSIVILCYPRPEDASSASRTEFLEELGKAMRAALPVLASGQVAPVDLAQASIGPGMAVYSRYSQVIRQDGRPVSVREALIDINNAIAGYRSERVSSYDGNTRFCVDWYDQHSWTIGKYGDAQTLARAYNVVPESMDRDGLLDAARGDVRLEPPGSYPVGVTGLGERNVRGSAWEACLRLARTLQDGGETAAALLVRELGEGAAVRARELAVWLYTIADARKRTEDAFLFNALDASWTGIQEQVSRQAEGTQARF